MTPGKKETVVKTFLSKSHFVLLALDLLILKDLIFNDGCIFNMRQLMNYTIQTKLYKKKEFPIKMIAQVKYDKYFV